MTRRFVLSSTLACLLLWAPVHAPAGPEDIWLPIGDQRATIRFTTLPDTFSSVVFTSTIQGSLPASQGSWEGFSQHYYTVTDVGGFSVPNPLADAYTWTYPLTHTGSVVHFPEPLHDGLANQVFTSTLGSGDQIVSRAHNVSNSGTHPESMTFFYTYNSFLNPDHLELQWTTFEPGQTGVDDTYPAGITLTVGNKQEVMGFDWTSGALPFGQTGYFPTSVWVNEFEVFTPNYTDTAAPSVDGTPTLIQWPDASLQQTPVLTSTLTYPSQDLALYSSLRTYDTSGLTVTYNFEYVTPDGMPDGAQAFTLTIDAAAGWVEFNSFGFTGDALDQYTYGADSLTSTFSFEYDQSIGTVVNLDRSTGGGPATDILDVTYGTAFPDPELVSVFHLYEPASTLPTVSVTSRGGTNIHFFDPGGAPLYHFVFEPFRPNPAMVIYLNDASGNPRGTLTIPTLADGPGVRATERMAWYIPNLSSGSPNYHQPRTVVSWSPFSTSYFCNYHDAANDLVQRVELSRNGPSILALYGTPSAITHTLPVMERRVFDDDGLQYLPPPSYWPSPEPGPDERRSVFLVY